MKKQALLTKEQLEKLPTKRLLAYKKSLMACQNTPHEDDWGNPRNYVTKADPQWLDAYNTLKTILNTREHVNRKAKEKPPYKKAQDPFDPPVPRNFR